MGLKEIIKAFRKQATPDPEKNQNVPAVLRGCETKHGRGACGGSSPLPEGKTWRPHVGNAQRLRGLRQNWALFEKLVKKAGPSSYAQATRERLLDSVADEPGAEFAAMQIALGSYAAVLETRGGRVSDENWVKAINDALNHWEAVKDASAKVNAERGVAL